jgi:hypothetical protein
MDSGTEKACAIHSALHQCLGNNGMANFKCSAAGDYNRFPDFIGTITTGNNAMQTAGVKCRVCGTSAAPTDLDSRPGYVQFYVTWGQIIDSQGSYTIGNTALHAKHEYQVWFIDSNGRMLGDTPAARVDAITYNDVNKTCCDADQYAVTIAQAMPTGMASLMIVPAFKVSTLTVSNVVTDVFAPLPMGQTLAVTDVTSGTTKEVVTGVLAMTVTNADAFIADPRNAQSFAKALATSTGVGVQYIIVTFTKVTTGGRRLGTSRRLTANINANYEITVPDSSAVTGAPSATDISTALTGTASLTTLQNNFVGEIAASGADTSNLNTAAGFTEVTAPTTQTQTTPAPVTTISPGSTGAAHHRSPASILSALVSIASTFGLLGMLK